MSPASSLLASRISFKGKSVTLSVAVSFLVTIIAICIASGFRNAIHDALADISGDIIVKPAGYAADRSITIPADSLLSAEIAGVKGVKEVRSCVYCAGILRNRGNVHGVFFKGVDGYCVGDTVSASGAATFNVRIPGKLASLLALEPGDKLPAYLIGDRLSLRKICVSEIYDALITDDDKLVVQCDAAMLRRALEMEDGESSSLEVLLNGRSAGDDASAARCSEISSLLYEFADSTGAPRLTAYRLSSAYPELFDWLKLVDNNVAFILLLMVIVAGFNMVSGLLVLLFRNIRTIGLMKALGMRRRDISGIFILVGTKLVAKGMVAGNALAVLLCLVQERTHFLKLDADNYFVSYVPVNIDLGPILLYDIVAFAAIVALMQIPCRFISSVDPARTLSVR